MSPGFPHRRPRFLALGALLAAAIALAGCGTAVPVASVPPVHHVFVIVLENAAYAESYGPSPKYSYLAQTLRSQGELLSQYYATAHYSLGNYLAILGGVGPNRDIQLDCGHYVDMVDPVKAADGQVKAAEGCVYPKWVPTLAGQLTSQKLTWKGYMEDLGAISGREESTCGKPALGADSADGTQKATAGDAYAARHNPFLYFSSIAKTAACAANVVPLARLPRDLASIETTPNFSFISPSLCNDGHDVTCVGQPAGPAAEDSWLREWVPRITASPAFRTDGALFIVNDEADSDSSACCGELAGPNLAHPGGPVASLKAEAGGGKGGGRVGALVLSPFVNPGSTSSVPYNHYSLLRSIEDLFGLGHIGFAGQIGLRAFGSDVWTARKSAR